MSSRIGAKRTLLLGLALIVVSTTLAGFSGTVGQLVGFRAGWGLGNALFIATALATIVSAAAGSMKQSVILFEAALGIGIATGPIVGGQLGEISWRAPFFGVAVLMTVALRGHHVHAALSPAAEDGGRRSPTRSARCATRGSGSSR